MISVSLVLVHPEEQTQQAEVGKCVLYLQCREDGIGMMVCFIMMKLMSSWFHVLQAANYGKKVICILSDDTVIFIVLVYWVYRAGLRPDGTVGWNSA